MQRVRLVPCSQKAASLFGELPPTVSLQYTVTTCLHLLRAWMLTLPKLVACRSTPTAVGARWICSPTLLSSIQRLSFRLRSAVGRSWLRAGSADFPRQVSEEEARCEAEES